MNKLIKQQLSEVNVDITYDDKTTFIQIPKTTKIFSKALEKGHIYVIKLNKSITNPVADSNLASNWNNGKVPQHDTYEVEFLTKVGNMYKFDGVAIEDNKDYWFGYFPEGQFTILERRW